MRAVNLLPRDERRRKPGTTNVKRQLALVALMLVAALVGAGYLIESRKANNERATLKALQEAIAQIPPPPPSSTPPVDASLVAQDHVRIAALSAALATRVAWDRILREISSVLPEDVWLTGLTAQTPGSAAAAAPTTTPTGAPSSATSAPLVLTGYTYSQEGVARFLARLTVIPELVQVQLQGSSLATLAGRPVFQFTINANLNTGATS